MEPLAIAAIAVLAVVVLGWAYSAGHLNWLLPTSMQRATFVGAFGRHPAMQHCLAFDGNHGRRQARFNRCDWV